VRGTPYEGHGTLGEQIGEVLAVLPDLAVVLPQVVQGVVVRILPPIEDVGVIVHAASQKAEPLLEAVVPRSAAGRQTEMPLADHGRSIAERGERGGQRRNVLWQPARGTVAGEDGAHTRVARVAARQERRARG